MTFDEVYLLPTDALGLLVIRGPVAGGQLAYLAARAYKINTRTIVMHADAKTKIDALDYPHTMQLLSIAADRLDSADLARLGLKRVTS